METSNSSKLPSAFFLFANQVIHFLVIPGFTFLFLILYKPFDLHSMLMLKHGGFAFNVTMVSVILLMVLLISRITFWGLRNMIRLHRLTYALWCFAEIIVAALFIAMYLSLMSGGEWTYMDTVPIALVELIAIVFIPYSIITLLIEVALYYKSSEEESDSSKLRFYDEKHNLKFVTDVNSLLFIESQENYCILHYAEADRLKTFMLRNTMKSLEGMCESRGILRCHRSYYVNMRRVSILKKEREGAGLVEMDFAGTPGIPVTSRYYEHISSQL